jgi:hypothetical protein
MSASSSNFTGTIISQRGCDVYPSTISDIQKCVARARNEGLAVRVCGNGLSFNGITQQDEAMRVHLTRHMNRVRRVYDGKKGEEKEARGEVHVVVQAGMTLWNLCEDLARQHGRALCNVPHYGGMTLGGALATGIHGTSGREGCDTLSASIVSVDLVNGLSQRVTLSAQSSLTLGLLGVVYQATLRTVPLYDVVQHAARIPYELAAPGMFQARIRADVITYDWVMYKYLCGARATTCIRETFTRSQDNPDTSSSSSSFLNSAQTVLDDARTWCKYVFPATPEATHVPWRDALYVWICERHHRAAYFRAMMGPQVVSPHAELEWCVPLVHLDEVLDAIDTFVLSMDETTEPHAHVREFYSQPIECHVRVSPPDTTRGHGAFESNRTNSKDWFAWVNLNVRQHLADAPVAFSRIETLLMQRHIDARVHWSKCWSDSPALIAHVCRQQAPFLSDMVRQSATHDPQRLFCSHPWAIRLGF